MSRFLNLDDAEALRIRCDAKAPDLFDEAREPDLQVIRVQHQELSADDETERLLSRTEDVMPDWQLNVLASVSDTESGT